MVKKNTIKVPDKTVTNCEAVFTTNKSKKEVPMISMEIVVPKGYAGTEVLLGREELLYMIDALNGMH